MTFHYICYCNHAKKIPLDHGKKNNVMRAICKLRFNHNPWDISLQGDLETAFAYLQYQPQLISVFDVLFVVHPKELNHVGVVGQSLEDVVLCLDLLINVLYEHGPNGRRRFCIQFKVDTSLGLFILTRNIHSDLLSGVLFGAWLICMS